LNSDIIRFQSHKSSVDVSSNTNYQDTNVTNICCFDRVVYILKIFKYSGYFLLQNLNLILNKIGDSFY